MVYMNIKKRFQRQQPNLKRLEDNALVELAKTGNKDAFGVLYERYLTKIYNYVYYRTGSVEDAEDLSARVFFRAMSHIGTYTDRGVPFQAWLYRIAHNLVANWHRDRNRRKIIPLNDYIASTLRSDAPDETAEDNDERGRLLAAIRHLPEDRQQLLILKFVQRLPNAEIGVIMNRTEGAVKSLYHRTLVTLRDLIEASDPDRLVTLDDDDDPPVIRQRRDR